MHGLSRAQGVDLLDADATRSAVAAAAPDVVYHLAAQAHVGRSWREPERTLRDNQAMTVHVLEAVRAAAEGGVRTIGFTGAGGGELAALAELCVRIPSDSTARIQEGYMLLCHTACELVERALFGS